MSWRYRALSGDDSGSAFAGLGRRGLVHRMHEQLDELLTARDQMEQLLRLIVEIGADLDLDEHCAGSFRRPGN